MGTERWKSPSGIIGSVWSWLLPAAWGKPNLCHRPLGVPSTLLEGVHPSSHPLNPTADAVIPERSKPGSAASAPHPFSLSLDPWKDPPGNGAAFQSSHEELIEPWTWSPSLRG